MTGKFWTKVPEGGFSGYTVQDCDDINNSLAAALNKKINIIRTDDFNFLAEEDGMLYFRSAIGTGKYVIDFSVLEKAKTTEQIHEIVGQIRELGKLSPEYKKAHQKKNTDQNC